MGGTTIVKVIAAIGIIALMAALLFPNSGVPAFNSLSEGFPTFENPFAATRTFTLNPAADDDTDPPLSGTDEFETEGTGSDDTNCDTNTQAGYISTPSEQYWGCIAGSNEPDGGQTRVTYGIGSPTFNVTLGSFTQVSENHLVRTITIGFNCQSGSAEVVRTNFAITDSARTPLSTGDFFDESVFCPLGPYANVSITNDVSLSSITIGDLNNGYLTAETGGTPSGALGLIQLTWLYVEVTYSPTLLCDQPDPIDQANCYISQAIQIGIDFLTLILNAGIFVGEWIILAFSFLADLATILVWLYAIPGMPTFAQALLDIVITTMIAYIVITIINKIRGTSE